VGLLKEAIQRNEVHHALVFTGPRGVGKATAALLFAAAVLCPSGEPDGCPSCVKVARKVHPDVHMVEAEGNVIRREQITELERELSRKPAEAARRVAIVDDAQLMNLEAANTFLKTLEEPPPETYIVLVAESLGAMLPTVVSRCQEVRFSALGSKEITEFLVSKEGLEAAEAERLARMSDGIFGRALLWARNPELAEHWERGVELAASLRKNSLLGLLEEGEAAMAALDEAGAPDGESELEGYLEAMDKRGRERLLKRWEERKKREAARIRRQAAFDLLDGMSSFYRDIMLLNLMEEESEEPSEAPLLNLERREELLKEALHIGPAEAMRRLESLRRARKALEANVDMALLMDSLLLELKGSA
jgi:DNA polymerase-3 subunit delta'